MKKSQNIRTVSPKTPSKILLINRLLISNEQGDILIVKRADNDEYRPSEWEFPGGKLELSEDISQSIHKEILEETAIDITIQSQIAYVESHIIEGDRYDGFTYVGIFGTATAVKPKIILSSEHSAYTWADRETCLDHVLTPECRRALIHLSKKVFPKG